MSSSLYTQPDDPFKAVMATLRPLRGGGEIMDPSELQNLLRARGHADVETDASPVATFVLGRLSWAIL